ncbi:hypothetical protein [Clostridium ganghwense]|uniref:Uncharacterized protein n=1 Tax=Clostridium ganghwense TaxID=312089 RepID=A0ABT4CNQ4_9CLOT|nr:hypothetical protein [Clostridium ganghwense]MCY6370686.1 hypothetical protein [Clostridium ganghwense]
MYNFICLLFIIGGLIYEKWWRPKVCEKKIRDRIRKMGGEVWGIERLSMREEIYSVIYRIGEKNEKGVVKFNLMYKQDWR